jgi:transcriptional regulator with XRE-family HTH domain
MSTKKAEEQWVAALPALEKLNKGPLTFAGMLWAIRRCEELSQTEMAEWLGISRANLCDIEKGRKLVSPQRAALWAKALGYSDVQFVRLVLQDQLRQAELKMDVDVVRSVRRKKAA